VRACSKCRFHVVTAQKPIAPIPGSYVGPNLLAYTCVAKLAYALPLYRQEKMHRRENARIPRSTQSNWMLTAGEMIAPLVDLIKAEIRKSYCIKTDDTEIELQDKQTKIAVSSAYPFSHLGERFLSEPRSETPFFCKQYRDS
jgi:transposase